MSDSENKVKVTIDLNKKALDGLKIVQAICSCESLEETIEGIILNYLQRNDLI